MTARGVQLSAGTTVGGLRGLETLLQLLARDSSGLYLPFVQIDDAPRFRWRGVLIDVSRHFMPPEAIRRTLDGMAVVKLNVLHWHLLGRPGIPGRESALSPAAAVWLRRPLLHPAGDPRPGRVCPDRGIRVVPEFDMPGHTTAWLVGYPEYASYPGPYEIERRFGIFDPTFDPTREEVYQFLDSFIGEMAALFPDAYLHIGGDEIEGKQWDRNPQIQAFMKEKGLKDNHALQAYFNQRMLTILQKHKKTMIGWDEILQPDLPRDAIIQSWRGTGRTWPKQHERQ